MIISLYTLTLMVALLSETGCEETISKYYDDLYTSQLYVNSGYDLSSPDTIISLDPALTEISGLSYLNETYLLAVEDEKGKLYVINSSSGKIHKVIKFHKSGDYEGVELVKDTVYIINSSGTLYQFALNLESTEVEAKEIKTKLGSKNNVEGLAYDMENNWLMIACKGAAQVDKNDAKGKVIYAYKLDGMELKKNPLYTLKKKKVKEILNEEYPQFSHKGNIGPSAVARHPLTGKTYVLAHVGKVLIVLDREGSIDAVYPLNPSIFQQPEGICFNLRGDMFISNEARDKRPNIMKFSFQK